jgi:hypothetical protein
MLCYVIPNPSRKLWSGTMKNAQCAKAPTNQVMALYANRARSFTLSSGATFADLADCLDVARVNSWHIDMPTAIYLKFATKPASSVNHQIRI